MISIFFLDIIDFIIQYKVWGIVIVLILIVLYLFLLILNPEKSAKARANYYRAIYTITKQAGAEKKYIENDIAAKLNTARKKMTFGSEFIPKSVKIEWFDRDGYDVRSLKKNEIIIKLNPMAEEEKNVVLVTEALVKRTSLVGIRYVLDKPIELVIDLNLIKKLLHEISERRVLDWFLQNEYQPKLLSSEETKLWNEKIVDMDERGLFIRMLLVELEDYAKRLSGKPRTSIMNDEIKQLIDFIYGISSRDKGQHIQLDLDTPNIKIGVILVGISKRILNGIEPYLNRYAIKLHSEVSTVYVITWDHQIKDEIIADIVHEEADKITSEIEMKYQNEIDFERTYRYKDKDGQYQKAKITRYIVKES